jgi:hypothetical protein
MCIRNPNGLPLAERFTYLGEEFGVSFDIEAQNAGGDRTENYVDGFAKLDNTMVNAGAFSVYEVLAGPDNDLTGVRLIPGLIAPAVSWPTNLEANRGLGSVSGNLIFDRLTTGEDGPYTDLNIGLNVSDTEADLVLDVDIDEVMPIANDVKFISTENFRYGRLLIDNAFGPETDELTIPFRIEYWDGGDWATNTLDSCTVLLYNASEADATMRSTFYVDGSWEGAIDADLNNADDGETVIENDAVIAVSDVRISVSAGQTSEAAGIDVNGDDQDDDRPLVTSAPGDGLDGSILVEFDLNHASLPYSLDFLSYDWRSTIEVDVLEPVEDNNYVNNPRGQINFGSYRGHDRVINWQEIYIGPGP